jgi:hypothetical protein
MYVLVYAAIFLALMRFGLLSGMLCLFFVNALGRSASNNDFTAWYMPNTVATMILLLAIALFAFWRSLGDQKLIGGSA